MPDFNANMVKKLRLIFITVLISACIFCQNGSDVPCCEGSKFDRDEGGITDCTYIFETFGHLSVYDEIKNYLTDSIANFDTVFDCRICE